MIIQIQYINKNSLILPYFITRMIKIKYKNISMILKRYNKYNKMNNINN
jgi:hypothetical protein